MSAVALGLIPFPVLAQVQTPAGSAILQGTVRDSQGNPLKAAAVYLQAENGKSQTVTSQADGAYRFRALPDGSYTVRAELVGCGEARFGPVTLTPGEVKTIDLTLASAASPADKDAAAPMPAFFDEPQFTVASVTDPTNLGGHGSDTVTRTKESLAKEVVSLGTGPSADQHPVPSSSPQEKKMREAAEREPHDFEANRRIGHLLTAEEKPVDALPYLEAAARLRPDDYGTSYDLALAYSSTGQYQLAAARLRSLLAGGSLSEHNQAETHHLLGDAEERLGDSLAAVHDYQRAAELAPGESTYFDWGAELLIHRATEPAIEVFTKGNHLFPGSVRMLVGLGVAWYARGSYDQAAKRLCQASDLNPGDANPYLFLGKLQLVDKAPSADSAERLARFARLQPQNPLANYYYSVSLWKQRKSPRDNANMPLMVSLLEKAVRLDPKLSAGYLQLGIVYSDQGAFPQAVAAYQSAISADPGMAEAHYRLAQVYRRQGENLEAEKELQLYEQASRQASELADRQRHEIQQFVYTLQGRPVTSPAK